MKRRATITFAKWQNFNLTEKCVILCRKVYCQNIKKNILHNYNNNLELHEMLKFTFLNLKVSQRII